MIAKKQTRLVTDTQRGNCLAAVIASMLEMEVEDVIQIQEFYDDPDWLEKLMHWFNEKGYCYRTADEFKCFHGEDRFFYYCKDILRDRNIEIDDYMREMQEELKDKYYFVSGESPRNKHIRHITIWQNGIMVHDPHPDNTGILTESDFTIIERK